MNKKILVIDDNPSILAMVEGILKSDGYTVRLTVDPSNGVKLSSEWNPDLILLDIMMPEVDGYSTALAIRKFSSVPIIFLTAKAEEQDILKGFEVGATDYIVKPFSAPEMLARTRAVLRRFETGRLINQPPNVYEHGDLLIDLDSAKVCVDGIEMNISSTEFKILMTLVLANGEIVSAKDLIKSVWGPHRQHQNSILYVAMSRLKQKIEKNPKNPVHIISIKGSGYFMPQDIQNPDEHTNALAD